MVVGDTLTLISAGGVGVGAGVGVPPPPEGALETLAEHPMVMDANKATQI
jgi:hypothetical protein